MTARVGIGQVATPRQHGRGISQTWQVVAAFVFGVTFIMVTLGVVIFDQSLTPFATFVLRVVLAMAAAGVGAVLPGFVGINAGPHIRAGGAVALFVIIYYFDPQASSTSNPTAADEALGRAYGALATDNLSEAAGFFDEALRHDPGSWKALHGLGDIEYRNGNFTVALEDYQKAFEITGKKDGALAYSIATAHEALGHYDEADANLRLAAQYLAPDSRLAQEVSFDRGLVNLIQWMNEGSPAETQHFRDAELGFRSFLDHRGFPTQWALYHLACLSSQRAEDPSLSAADAAALHRTANDELELAVKTLSSWTSDRAPAQQQMMERVLRSPDTWSHLRKAGDPVACPALIQSWKQAHGSIDGLTANFA